MRPVQNRQRHAPAKAARFCACAVLVAFSSCSRKEDQYGAPEPAQTSEQEMPHFIPPKDRRGAADAGGIRRAPSAALPNQRPDATGVTASFPPGRGCAENMARVGNFCIDRFEIHLIGRDGSVHPHFQPPPRGMEGLFGRSGPGVLPQGHLSQETSRKACENSGKRLCTLDEWQQACSGGGARRFPYGNEPISGMCNAGKRDPHILDKHFPDIPHMQRTGKHFNDPALLQDPDYLMRSGEMAECATPEGVYDIDGNLSEWVSDTVQKGGMAHGTFAGDAFSGHGSAGCSRKTSAHTSDYLDYSMGTRCCKNPGR